MKIAKCIFSVEGIGDATANTDEYYCSIGQTANFITEYITIFPGDVVTLGHTKNRITIPKDKVFDGMKITAGIKGIGDIEITLKIFDAHDTLIPFIQLKL